MPHIIFTGFLKAKSNENEKLIYNRRGRRLTRSWVGPPVFLKGCCRHECFPRIDVPLTNLKPALFLGKELEDMIHHDVFKVVLSHTDFTDPENEKVTIFAFRAEVDLSAVAWFISELKF